MGQMEGSRGPNEVVDELIAWVTVALDGDHAELRELTSKAVGDLSLAEIEYLFANSAAWIAGMMVRLARELDIDPQELWKDTALRWAKAKGES